ncbi:hypothetical protein BV898_08001 [Hypsibius exemplaris]|uniref:R3H domain-containing protein 2 n=1 Tax=Hypsibius exemplaris TaxID=2072580 RepID=A0A1W0WRP2_HYPEX|nr:hypothetical protein BV898_08001 [Hypsibius exemplaris]
MVDSVTDLRVKNKLEKQDEIEVSDEEDVGGLVDPQQQRRRSTAKKAASPAPASPALSNRLPKQTSAPAYSDRSQRTTSPHVSGQNNGSDRKSSMPLAYVQFPDSGTMHHQMRNELIAPRHLGSMAFSSMSTEESTISDVDAMSRQIGMLSVQGSLQDDAYGGTRKLDEEDFGEFLVGTWHKQPQDRSHMLNFERTLENMLRSKNENAQFLSPPLNSYYRMLLHRMAAYWGFEHLPDMNRGQTAVLVKITQESRRPDQIFRTMVDQSIPEEPAPTNFLIMKRPKDQSPPEPAHAPVPQRPIMSLDEKQANYDRVRQKIFGSDDYGNDGDQTPQPYGLPPNYDNGSQQAQVAGYNRSRSVQSDVSSEANYDAQTSQMRPMYGDPYGQGLVRPVVATGQSVYGAPYGYLAGGLLGGYPGAIPDSGAYLDPAVFQQMQHFMAQQQLFYQTYGQYPQYQPQQTGVPVHPGMQFAQQQQGYPLQGYSSQGSFDQSQYGQFAYQQQQQLHQQSQQYHPGMGDASSSGGAGGVGQSGQLLQQYSLPPQAATDPSLRLQTPTVNQAAAGGSYMSSPGSAAAGDSCNPQLQQQLQQSNNRSMQQRFNPSVSVPGNHHGDSNNNSNGGGGGGGGGNTAQSPNNAFIIPLRFPPMGMGMGMGHGNSPSSMMGGNTMAGGIGMFLKLPCVRPGSSSVSTTGGGGGGGGGGGTSPSGGENHNNNGSYHPHGRRISRNNSGRSSVDRQNSGQSPSAAASSGKQMMGRQQQQQQQQESEDCGLGGDCSTARKEDKEQYRN